MLYLAIGLGLAGGEGLKRLDSIGGERLTSYGSRPLVRV